MHRETFSEPRLLSKVSEGRPQKILWKSVGGGTQNQGHVWTQNGGTNQGGLIVGTPWFVPLFRLEMRSRFRDHALPQFVAGLVGSSCRLTRTSAFRE